MKTLSTAILAFALYRGELVQVSMSEEEYWNLVEKQREEEKAQVQKMIDSINASVEYWRFVCYDEPDADFTVTGHLNLEAGNAGNPVALNPRCRPRPMRRFLLHGISEQGSRLLIPCEIFSGFLNCVEQSAFGDRRSMGGDGYNPAQPKSPPPLMLPTSQKRFAVFKEVMVEHPIWEEGNFGVQLPLKPLLGIQEEIGELAHAVLKGWQGVRITNDEEKKDKVRDAIGDTLVYLISYCNKVNIQLIQALTDMHLHVPRLLTDYNLPSDFPTEESIYELPIRAGRCIDLLARARNRQYSTDFDFALHGVMGLLYCLEKCAEKMLGEDLEICLERAWKEVKARDWKFNPWNGQSHLPLGVP